MFWGRVDRQGRGGLLLLLLQPGSCPFSSSLFPAVFKSECRCYAVLWLACVDNNWLKTPWLPQLSAFAFA